MKHRRISRRLLRIGRVMAPKSQTILPPRALQPHTRCGTLQRGRENNGLIRVALIVRVHLPQTKSVGLLRPLALFFFAFALSCLSPHIPLPLPRRLKESAPPQSETLAIVVPAPHAAISEHCLIVHRNPTSSPSHPSKHRQHGRTTERCWHQGP